MPLRFAAGRGAARPPLKHVLVLALLFSVGALACLSGCSSPSTILAGGIVAPESITVGVAPATRKTLVMRLKISSELVPFQEIDVYAKEAGYVKSLLVDYGTRVQSGQLMAVLDIPELEIMLHQDAAAIQSATSQVAHAQHELNRLQAQHEVYHLQYARLKGVMDKRPGLIAQQELDDAQGKDLAAEAQDEAGESTLQTARSQMDVAAAKAEQDRVLFEYSRVTAPFSGVVTQRYANLGALMQAGTSSSTQATPLVRLSQDDLFRLVIPVPESYVKYICIGDLVQVSVPSLKKIFPGKVARFSVDVNAQTRTMHTEVDVPNPSRVLMPGLYAEALLTLERKGNALVVPLQAINQAESQATVQLVDPNHMLRERKITLGMQTATEVEVLSGLNEGDRVVISDRSGLKEGMEVQPRMAPIPRYQDDKEQ